MQGAGVFRIIRKHTDNLAEAYIEWFNIWFSDLPKTRINFKINKDVLGQLVYDNNEIHYYNKKDRQTGPIRSILKALQRFKQHDILMAHGQEQSHNRERNQNICRYRKHGVLFRYFTRNQELGRATLPPELAAELFEVLMTKVCIFDNRLFSRIEKPIDKDFFHQVLNCTVYEEDKSKWEAFKMNNINSYHFLVMHLSFIEGFKDSDQNRLGESRVGEFIEGEILSQLSPKNKKNFILVITTGRGRNLWWNALNRKYKYFTTFRPVESLISCFEYGLRMQDDIELKYRLVKVLFGS